MLALMILWGRVVRVLTGGAPSAALRLPGMSLCSIELGTLAGAFCMRGACPLKQPASKIHGRADPVITRATGRLAHAFNDEKAYLVDRRP